MSSAAPRPNSRPFAFDGGEGVGFPQCQVAGGLDVVVGVQQDCRLALRGRAAGDDGGPAGRPVLLVAAEDPDVVEAAGPHEAGDGVGAAVQRGGSKLGQAMPGMATRSVNWLIVSSNDSVTAWRRASASMVPSWSMAVCGFPAVDEVMAQNTTRVL